MAAGFAIGGASLFTPRTIIGVLGALTVLPTYLLGRTIGLSLAGDRAHGVLHPGIIDRDAWPGCCWRSRRPTSS